MSRIWLVTTREHVTIDDLRRKMPRGKENLSQRGAPIPMGADEIVLEVEGPDDLDRKLKLDASVLGVHPSSSMVPYGRR